jgi:hypothetical protein
MSKKRKTGQAMLAADARFGARFWDAVEHEIEVLDEADFALFLAADRLPIEPRADFADALGRSLSRLCRARFSN